tara:strand:- start:622 stop:1779 length:1158 start_codon:yes stop_codon:yes gene_type:complete
MKLGLGLIELAGIVACSQALILAAQLWFSGGENRRANQALAYYILAQAVYLAMVSWAFSDYRPPVFSLYHLVGIIYLYGPLFYVYAHLLTGQGDRLASYWRHFVVPLMLWATLPIFQDTEILQAHTSYQTLPVAVKKELAMISFPSHLLMLLYTLWTLELLGDHRRRIRDHFSSLDKINLMWLAALAGLMGVMSGVLLFLDAVGMIAGRFFLPGTGISFIVTIATINYIGVMSFRQPAIFHGRAPADVDISAGDIIEDADMEKYQKSGLSEERVDDLWARLQKAMVEEQLFLRQGLKLDDLAKEASTHSNYLSQVINSRAGVNFYDFVNGHRVAFAEALLKDGASRRTIADIAEASGFASLNAFNSHFKKRLGCTPSAYRKQAKV